MSKSFLIVTIAGRRRMQPVDDTEIPGMIERGEAKQVSRRVYEKIMPNKSAAGEYETKVMTPAPKRRGRPRKVAP